MRAPALADDELARDLAKKLDRGEPATRPAIVEDIRRTIATLREIVGKPKLWNPPLWGNQTENLEHVATIRKRIDKLMAGLEAVPDSLLFSLFAPEDAETLDVMMRQAEAKGELFTTLLGNLHARCELLAADKPGEHGNAGYRQRQAAVAAREIMERWGHRVTYSSENCLFAEIAQKLYQASTGEHPSGMERACEAVMRAEIRTE